MKSKKNNIKKKITLLILIMLISSFDKKNINSYYSPKISIFLPIYNKANYLKKSIRSIQKQTLKDIEIIAVNDCSEDNTLQILMEFAKNDLRIKIVNNDKNRGLLYSRAMGILNSKGEYLMNLDPDDELEGPGNLKYLYKIAKKSEIDLISFGIIIKNGLKRSKKVFCSKINKIQNQPEIINSHYKYYDYLIWNKLVKKKVFLNSYLLFKEKIFQEKWNYGEDEIWSSLIYKNANSMICIKKSIYIYNINNNSLMSNINNILYLKNLINWIEMFKQNFDKKFLINRLYSFITIIRYNKNYLNIINNNTELRNKYIELFNNINNQYIFNNSDLSFIIDSFKK